MKITDDVIRDLLPLYVAGEVSSDTRALVEAYLTQHPALAAEARDAAAAPFPAVPGLPSRDIERQALRRTKTLLARRSWALGAALFFSTLPFSFAIDQNGFHWLFWPQFSGLAITSLILALNAWGIFLWVSRGLKPRGF